VLFQSPEIAYRLSVGFQGARIGRFRGKVFTNVASEFGANVGNRFRVEELLNSHHTIVKIVLDDLFGIDHRTASRSSNCTVAR
jgi:hypothetical protein